MLGICAVVVVFGVVMFVRIGSAKEELDILNTDKAQLEKELESESERADALEQRKIYKTTKMYIEEMAKQLGLVYPDEIIYRPTQP